jgi:hypothetical protein
MTTNFGVLRSGNLEYALNPAATVRAIMESTLRKLEKTPDKRITEIYGYLQSGNPYKYVFRSGSTWSVSENHDLQNLSNQRRTRSDLGKSVKEDEVSKEDEV